MSGCIGKVFHHTWPYIKRSLFKDQSVQQSLKKFWYIWFILGVETCLFIVLFFIYEQALLQSRKYAELVKENTEIRLHLQEIRAYGFDSVETALDVGRKLIHLETEIAYYKDLYVDAHGELAACKADDTAKSTTLKPYKRVYPIPQPHAHSRHSIGERLNGLSEID